MMVLLVEKIVVRKLEKNNVMLLLRQLVWMVGMTDSELHCTPSVHRTVGSTVMVMKGVPSPWALNHELNFPWQIVVFLVASELVDAGLTSLVPPKGNFEFEVSGKQLPALKVQASSKDCTTKH